MLAEAIVAEDLKDGRLRRVLPQWQAEPIAVHAVTETRLLPAKTQRFIEFLSECLNRT
jgi:DNA-binding transcriptional LysR family regulator